MRITDLPLEQVYGYYVFEGKDGGRFMPVQAEDEVLLSGEWDKTGNVGSRFSDYYLYRRPIPIPAGWELVGLDEVETTEMKFIRNGSKEWQANYGVRTGRTIEHFCKPEKCFDRVSAFIRPVKAQAWSKFKAPKRYFTFKPGVECDNDIAFWSSEDSIKGGICHRKNGSTTTSSFICSDMESLYREISAQEASVLLDSSAGEGYYWLTDEAVIQAGDECCYKRDIDTSIKVRSSVGKTVAVASDRGKYTFRRKLSAPNNNSTEEINTNMNNEVKSKFKAGDRVKLVKASNHWDGVMTVTRLVSGHVYAQHPKHGEGCWLECELTLAHLTKFQVDTRGLEGVKRGLDEAARINRKDYKSGFSSFSCNYKYMHFNFSCQFQTAYHTEDLYEPHNYPLVSIDEALTILTSKPEPIVAEIKLNATYTVVVTQGADMVKVGCQEIPVAAVKALVAKITELEKGAA